MHAVPSALLVAVALLAGCSQSDLPDGDRLPDGQYPITLTAAVEGQTVTRATVDNTWAGTEEVALQVGGEVKKYTVATGGAMTAADGVQYWTNKTMTVQAWHSPQGYSATRPASFTVQADQNTNSGAGYQQSDMLYTSQNITYNAATPPQLTFKHLPVKVVVNLSNGGGVTETDVQNATVTFVNQALTSGAIGYDDNTGAVTSVAQAAGKSIITPKVSASATSGYQKTVEALLVPQQMQGKQFVKIMVGSGAAARTYYYVPKGNDANLEHGNQYTYCITVKKEKEKLEVTVQNNGTQWTDNSINGGDPVKKEYYVITLPATSSTGLSNVVVTNSQGQTIPAETDGVSYHLSTDQSAFNISYTSANAMKSLVPVSGLADFSRTDNSNSGSFTANYTRVCSDITLSYDDYAKVGDYYYSDGTWGPGSTPPSGSDATAIGVVFYTGVGSDDALSNYSSISGMTKIHGYVVAAKDLLSSANTSYGGKLPKNSYGYLQNFDVPEIENNNIHSYNGYAVTKIIREKYIPKTTEYEFPAFAACATYHTDTQAAPANSSGWYLPSAAMLPAINNIKSRCADCPNGSAPDSDYMSCSEMNMEGVQGYAFHKSQYTGRSKNDDNTKARAVLTF